MKILNILNEEYLTELGAANQRANTQSSAEMTEKEKEYDKIGQALEATASANPKLLDDPRYKEKLNKYRAWKKTKTQPGTTGTQPATGTTTSAQLNVDQLKSAFNFNSTIKPEVIAQIQKILEHLKIKPVGQSGVNNEMFIYALANYQQQAGLPVNGKYTKETKSAMEKQLKINPLPKTDKPTDPQSQDQKPEDQKPEDQKPEVPGSATVEDFNNLPGEVFTHPGSNIQYKIVKTMPYRNDNDVTMVLLAQHLEGLVFFFIFGLDPAKRREFVPDTSTDKIKTDFKKMEQLFNSEYRLKGPYLYGPGTLPDTISQKI
jgi:hypothetical protein